MRAGARAAPRRARATVAAHRHRTNTPLARAPPCSAGKATLISDAAHWRIECPLLPGQKVQRVPNAEQQRDAAEAAVEEATNGLEEEEEAEEEAAPQAGDPLASFDGEAFDAHGGAAVRARGVRCGTVRWWLTPTPRQDLEPTPLPSPERQLPGLRPAADPAGFSIASLNGIGLQHVSRWDLTPADMATRVTTSAAAAAGAPPPSLPAAATPSSPSVVDVAVDAGAEWAELMQRSKEELAKLVLELRARVRVVGGEAVRLVGAAAGSPACSVGDGGRGRGAPPGGSV